MAQRPSENGAVTGDATGTETFAVKEDSALGEALRTTPGRLLRFGVYLFLAFVLALFAFAYFVTIDVVVSAPVIMVPGAKVRLIPAEGDGVVERLPVAEGGAVAAGQEVAAVRTPDVHKDLLALQAAEAELRDAEVEAKDLAALKAAQVKSQLDLLGRRVRHQEAVHRSLTEQIAQEETARATTQLSFQLETAKQKETVARLRLEARTLTKIAAEARRQLEINLGLRRSNTVSEQDYSASLQASVQAEGNVLSNASQLKEAETDAQIITQKYAALLQGHDKTLTDLRRQAAQAVFDREATEAEREQKRAEADLVAHEAAKKVATARLKRDQARQNLARLAPDVQEKIALGQESARLETVYRAPCAGQVGQWFVRGPGEAVGRGQSLVSVVPVGTPWVAEIRVANRDVGLITTGLAVKLKLDAFPFVDFGYLQATVTEVLPDAEPSPTPGGPTVYRVLAALDNVQFKFRKGGQQLPLRSGLTGTAEIVTDRKTLWQLLLNPLQREFQEANPAQP